MFSIFIKYIHTMLYSVSYQSRHFNCDSYKEICYCYPHIHLIKLIKMHKIDRRFSKKKWKYVLLSFLFTLANELHNIVTFDVKGYKHTSYSKNTKF